MANFNYAWEIVNFSSTMLGILLRAQIILEFKLMICTVAWNGLVDDAWWLNAKINTFKQDWKRCMAKVLHQKDWRLQSDQTGNIRDGWLQHCSQSAMGFCATLLWGLSCSFRHRTWLIGSSSTLPWSNYLCCSKPNI